MFHARLAFSPVTCCALVMALLITTAPLWAQDDLAIVGGTIVDVSDFGRSTADLVDQTILVEDGWISAIGPSPEMTIPAGFRIIRAQDKFITPGLTDGFAVLNNQAYAQAYLAMGVTTIVGVDGGRRGPLFLGAVPGPQIYRLADVGYEPLTDEDLLVRVQQLADDGIRVALLMYRLTRDQLRLANNRAHELGLATIGELAEARYVDGMNFGLDAFVHTTRYSLGMAPSGMVAGIAREPFSDNLDSPKWTYYRWLSGLKPDSPEVSGYARRLARSKTFLVPTASLLYLHQPRTRNPWTYPVARLLSPMDIDHPADKVTGVPPWTTAQLTAYRTLAAATELLETANRAAGCHYLAGSGTDVWGTMPGISLHTELAALVRWGLTPREALAAATSNFAVAYRWSELGAVAAGCQANILILAADPRTDVTNLQLIDRVIARGVVLDPVVLMKKPTVSNN